MTGLIWLDGAMVPWREAKVHVLTHTLHYGMGVFEGIRAYETGRGTAILRLNEHIGRLCRSARILGIPMPYDHATLSGSRAPLSQSAKVTPSPSLGLGRAALVGGAGAGGPERTEALSVLTV